MRFNITYLVPYEGDCTIHDNSINDVIKWLEENSFNGYSEGCTITPTSNPEYDEHSFLYTFKEIRWSKDC